MRRLILFALVLINGIIKICLTSFLRKRKKEKTFRPLNSIVISTFQELKTGTGKCIFIYNNTAGINIGCHLTEHFHICKMYRK